MTEDNKRTWTEELEIAGKDLLSVIESVIKDGTAKRVVIRNKEGRSLLEIPLAAGVAVGGAAVLMAPVFAAISAMAALMSEVKVEIVRSGDQEEDGQLEGDVIDVGPNADGEEPTDA